MRLNSVKILKISITCDSKQKILEEVRKSLKKPPNLNLKTPQKDTETIFITTPNPEQTVLAEKKSHFANFLSQADVALPDGIGIVLAAQFLGVKNEITGEKVNLQRIPGVEFMEELAQMAAEESIPVALIGGRPGLAVEAFDRLRQQYLGLEGWAEEAPEFKIESLDLFISDSKNTKGVSPDQTEEYFVELAQKIKKTGVRMVFVGLGAPKQEYFMEKLSAQLKIINCLPAGKAGKLKIIMMSVGGSFEMITGKIRRAPLFIRLIGFEWLWRLLIEPWRWRRQLDLIRFIQLVLVEKLDK